MNEWSSLGAATAVHGAEAGGGFACLLCCAADDDDIHKTRQQSTPESGLRSPDSGLD